MSGPTRPVSHGALHTIPAFRTDKSAREFFEKLAPGYRKQFIAWVAMAKRPETKAARVKESLALLARGEKLGLK